MHTQDITMMTDFYEFTMAYAYFKEKRHEEIAYFDMFIRRIPDGGGYLIFNGLNRLIEAIQSFRFTEEQLTYLQRSNVFDDEFIDYLRHLKLNLDIWSVEEGMPVFENEPLVTVRGTYIQAQLIETLLLLCVNYPILITTKASRIVTAARGRAVMEFGARRAQGMDASLEGARAAVIAGCVGTSCTLAGMKFGIPISGTIAHSYIQLHESEYAAFLSYSQIQPQNAILLVDTYDTLKSGVPNAIKVAHDFLIPNGYRLKGIRLDSGDLAYLSKRARKMLDDAGLTDCKILASNSLDEEIIDDLILQDAKIDSFGVGENLITSKSSPVLGGVYKVVAFEKEGDIIPKIKISENIEKITNPGFKKLIRFYDKDTHKALGDLVCMADEVIPYDSYTLFDPVTPWKKKVISNYTYKQLQVPVFVNGNLVYTTRDTLQTRDFCKEQMETMWDEVKRLRNPHRYYVDLSMALWNLKNRLIEENRK
ncbi:MAG: nicotinate phosphoribosyltransferase [Firmicutes bacterium GWF2_51_9]|nr:MAG: nicotinate phosphoribosyltransferase [Firmicutes bacterium GWF2_51_9]OGS59139.1 MAG: nicotinate phosphoribosyltransferase [Firmicutes bacterium GWE2_51_13]HBZ41245.1 nicotinate phosphoribosyltransferase [Erysipelotrichaceae bacterium]